MPFCSHGPQWSFMEKCARPKIKLGLNDVSLLNVDNMLKSVSYYDNWTPFCTQTRLLRSSKFSTKWPLCYFESDFEKMFRIKH